jgi:hypothetical protein
MQSSNNNNDNGARKRELNELATADQPQVEETTTKLQKLDCSNLEVCILNLTK